MKKFIYLLLVIFLFIIGYIFLFAFVIPSGYSPPPESIGLRSYNYDEKIRSAKDTDYSSWCLDYSPSMQEIYNLSFNKGVNEPLNFDLIIKLYENELMQDQCPNCPNDGFYRLEHSMRQMKDYNTYVEILYQTQKCRLKFNEAEGYYPDDPYTFDGKTLYDCHLYSTYSWDDYEKSFFTNVDVKYFDDFLLISTYFECYFEEETINSIKSIPTAEIYHEICLSKTGDVIDCQFFRDEIEQREMADLNIQ